MRDKRLAAKERQSNAEIRTTIWCLACKSRTDPPKSSVLAGANGYGFYVCAALLAPVT